MLGVDAMRAFSAWKEESSLHSINNNMLLIGMSANASTDDQNEAFEAGMHFFASKPVEVKVLSLLVEKKKSCLDLNETIHIIRSVAMSSEDTGDVYSSQRYNLRSPPNNCKLKSKLEKYNTKCSPLDDTSAHSNRLERYACTKNINSDVTVKFAAKPNSDAFASTTFRSESENETSHLRNMFNSESMWYTLQRYLCWTRSSKIRN